MAIDVTKLNPQQLKVHVHEQILASPIKPGSELLRDFGYSQAERLLAAVKALKADKAVDVIGPLVDADPKSVFSCTISIHPARRAYSRVLLQQAQAQC
jgi:hypothetical protein